MSAKDKLELTCDLCRWPPTVLQSKQDAEALGWLTIGQQGYYTDRDFFDSHVCPSCAKKLRLAVKAQVDRELTNEMTERMKHGP